ncbi:MAG: hydroxyethylthiazole kinase [Candidatus Carbobacillus altaicus]|uniref:Hydroxyethylthiazole kinase n=1 Tax=Candidatus Carbonibacillus altaicus TaxID=2163959 RepID=A0A2R6XXM9_9BACL|nr:hydroxyethylthiazole kinase [Candidatus Carbobacillus altaicus]PTQ55180.1 MAG: Hydroxyethylthiazole kinase [Candidatus Carbobacillus altaicus]
MNAEAVRTLTRRIREKHPLIHSITNTVVQNFTANGLLALGASPVMADAPEEAGEMARAADGLLINIGTLTSGTREAMNQALLAANAKGIPTVLDPVGVGATAYRNETVQSFLSTGSFTVIRGNIAEIAHTIERPLPLKGVDAGEVPLEVRIEVTREAAQKLEAIVAATGPEDVITDGRHTLIVQNGDAWMTRVTGVGCLLGAVVAAYLAVADDPFQATSAALLAYGVAGEVARERLRLHQHEGIGSYGVRLIDALDELPDLLVEDRLKFYEVHDRT